MNWNLTKTDLFLLGALLGGGLVQVSHWLRLYVASRRAAQISLRWDRDVQPKLDRQFELVRHHALACETGPRSLADELYREANEASRVAKQALEAHVQWVKEMGWGKSHE